MIYYIIGMIISVLFDWYYYRKVKNGVEIENYPKTYLKMKKYKLFREWVLWSLIWPIIFIMSFVSYIKGLKG